MPAARRRSLVDAAATEFACQGYENASLNAIIRRCSMSKSSFYYLFDSKVELFDFVVTELLELLAGTVAIPAPHDFAEGDFWTRVEALFVHLTQAAASDDALRNLGRMFYGEAPEDARRSVASSLQAARNWVQEVVKAGRSTGAVADDLPESLQCDLTFGVLQIFDRWSVDHVDASDGAQAEALVIAQFAALKRLLGADPA